jgi:hypothetical protein
MVNKIRATRSMTVTGVICTNGATARLDAPIRVEAGQQIRFGFGADGMPVVSVASDTPIFDGIRLSSIQSQPVLGFVCCDIPHPRRPEPIAETVVRGLGLDSHDTDREWALLHDADETVEPIFAGIALSTSRA